MRIRTLVLILIVFLGFVVAPYIGAVDLKTNLIAHFFCGVVYTFVAMFVTEVVPTSEREFRALRGWNRWSRTTRNVVQLVGLSIAWFGPGMIMYIIWLFPAYGDGSFWAALGLSVFTRCCQIGMLSVMRW